MVRLDKTEEELFEVAVSIPYRYGTTWDEEADGTSRFWECQFLIGMVRLLAAAEKAEGGVVCQFLIGMVRRRETLRGVLRGFIVSIPYRYGTTPKSLVERI